MVLRNRFQNTSGWKSQISTTANSDRGSPPVSPSDLPASPTFYSRKTLLTGDSPPGNESGGSADMELVESVQQITLTAHSGGENGETGENFALRANIWFHFSIVPDVPWTGELKLP